jgi:hypothetical protein
MLPALEPLESGQGTNWRQGLLPGSQGQHLAVTVVYVPSSLDSRLERGYVGEVEKFT